MSRMLSCKKWNKCTKAYVFMGPRVLIKKFSKGPIGILILLRTVKQDFLHFAMSNTSGMGLFVPKSEIFI